MYMFKRHACGKASDRLQLQGWPGVCMGLGLRRTVDMFATPHNIVNEKDCRAVLAAEDNVESFVEYVIDLFTCRLF